MLRLLALFSVLALGLAFGCDDDDDSAADAAVTNEDAAVVDDDAAAADDDAAVPSEECIATCDRFAECGISECPGYDDSYEEYLTDSCLVKCAATAALSTLITPETACSRVKEIAAGVDADFAACCEDSTLEQCGAGGE